MRVDCVGDLRKKSVLDKMFDLKLHLANKCTRSLTPNPQPFVLSGLHTVGETETDIRILDKSCRRGESFLKLWMPA